MKLRDLERHLLTHVARKVGEGGRHTKWRSADGLRATAVPRHREIGPGLVRESAGNWRSRPLTARDNRGGVPRRPRTEDFLPDP